MDEQKPTPTPIDLKQLGYLTARKYCETILNGDAKYAEGFLKALREIVTERSEK